MDYDLKQMTIEIINASLADLKPRGPHSDILMMGEGGDRSYILYPKKSQLQNMSTQKNPTPAVNCTYVVVVVELMKSTIPKKITVYFLQPKKSLYLS